MSDETVEQQAIRCPQCKSTNWRCWDQEEFDCWNDDGIHVGTKVVGHLACRDCGAAWDDVSVECPEDSTCEDD